MEQIKKNIINLMSILLFISFLMISSVFASEPKIDNSDFIVVKTLWQKMSDFSLDATSGGYLSGSPDKVSQVRINENTDHLTYPLYYKDAWILYEYYEPKCNNQGADFFGDYIQLNVMTSCDLDSSIMTLQKKIKVFIKSGTGKDKSGNSYLDVKDDFYSGVTHIKRSVYFVNDKKPVKSVESKWLNYYTCGANNYEFRMWQNSDGSQLEKQYKQCGECIDLSEGRVSCLESKKNPSKQSLIGLTKDEIINDNNGDGLEDNSYNLYDPTVPEIPVKILNYDSKTGLVKENGTTYKVCKQNEDLIKDSVGNLYCSTSQSNNDTTSFNLFYVFLGLVIIISGKKLRWF